MSSSGIWLASPLGLEAVGFVGRDVSWRCTYLLACCVASRPGWTLRWKSDGSTRARCESFQICGASPGTRHIRQGVSAKARGSQPSTPASFPTLSRNPRRRIGVRTAQRHCVIMATQGGLEIIFSLNFQGGMEYASLSSNPMRARKQCASTVLSRW